ncbi:MAG: NAD(P)H-hydrate dehydratase [Candidatus Woesearchaeota archaeon]
MKKISYTKKSCKALLARSNDTHKGQSGKVLCIAGSISYPGSALLCSVASLRIGADYVWLASPEKVTAITLRYCPDIVPVPLCKSYLTGADYSALIKIAQRADVLLIGPGIGKDSLTKKAVQKILSNKDVDKKLKVIDADALSMISLKELSNTILTPHLHEYKQVCITNKIPFPQSAKNTRELCMPKNSSFLENIQKVIGTNCMIIKGNPDIVITRKSISYNETGNPGMAKAGTGDILAGLCAGILAKTKSIESSAKLSVWLNGRLGDSLQKKMNGYFFIASDFLTELKEW